MKIKLHNKNIQLNYLFIVLIGIIGSAIVFFLPSISNFVKAVDNNPGTMTLKTQHILPLKVAQQLSTAAQSHCNDKGYSVTVSVLNRDGVDIILLRGDGTPGATVDVSRGKAYAAVGFQSPTSGMEQRVKSANPGIMAIERFVVLPGGLPIRAGSELVGGIGVAGAPNGSIDEECAKAGIEAITPILSNVNTTNMTNINNNNNLSTVNASSNLNGNTTGNSMITN
ncbi:MAG: GlcG/HbpS family heme-binding protein [Candidatus Nitrosocosmicus sp.]